MDKPRALSPVPAVKSPSKYKRLKRAAHIFPEVIIVEYGSLSPDEDQGLKSPDLRISKRFVGQTATAPPPQERRCVIRTQRPRPRRQNNLNIETPSERSHSNINVDVESSQEEQECIMLNVESNRNNNCINGEQKEEFNIDTDLL